MARRPGLEKVTKTIPLGGGISDEIPEFLLAPPGMAYIENATFQKVDQATKTEPISATVATGTTGKQFPYALYEERDKLITIGEDIATFDGTSWTTKPLPYEPLGLESVLSTAGESGGSCYSWAPFEYLDSGNFIKTGYCVAFERRNHGSQATATTCDIVIQRFDDRGIFFDETTLMPPGATDSFSPLVQPAIGFVATQQCVVVFCDNTGQAYRVRVPDITDTFTPSYDTIAAAPNVIHTGQVTLPTILFPEGSRRISATSASSFHAAIKYKQTFEDIGIMGWKSNGSIIVQRTSVNGELIFSAVVVAADTVQSEEYVLLDVDIDDTYIYVLVAARDVRVFPGPQSSRVDVLRRTISGGVTETFNLKAASNTVDFQGAIKIHPNGRLFAAFTTTNGTELFNFQSEYTEIQYATVENTWLSSLNAGVIRNHVIASNVVYDSGGYANLVVQQWGNYSPRADAYLNTDGDYALTPASQKPVTSALVKVLGGTPRRHTVLAVFDSGQSRDRDGSYQELNQNYGNLYYIDNKFDNDGNQVYDMWSYGNRVVLTAEDFYYWATLNPASSGSEERQPLLVGEARFNVYNASPSIKIRSSVAGGGLIINSALPLMYASGDITELSVLDQPEIVAVFSNATNEPAQLGYNILERDPLGYPPRIFQAVVGFFDKAGNVHRSAPSLPVFAGGITMDIPRDEALPQTPDTRAVTVHVTKPLGYKPGTDYFCEIYVTDGSTEEPQLAEVVHFDPTDHTDQLKLDVDLLQEVTGANLVANVTRQSEFIYTTGDVLPSDPWPDIDLITSTSRRMFASSKSNPGTIYHSKLFEENVTPEFSAALVISIGSYSAITAMGIVDDKVIIFEKDKVHVLYGRGPDNTGANGDFTVERIQTPLGCTDPESVILTSDGLIYFSSASGEFHLISRDLVVNDIGGPILDLTPGINITSAILYPEQDEVRFSVLGDGTEDWGADPDTSPGVPSRPPQPRMGRSFNGSAVFAYNTKYAKWSLLSNPPSFAVTLFNNKPAELSGSWGFRQVTDNWALGEAMVWETPWIRVNQLQDFGRFYWATVLGKYLSSWNDYGDGFEAGDLQITVHYDYEGLNGDTDTYIFRANVDFDPTYGERLQFRVRPGRQKCQALKFVIEEINTTPLDNSEPNYTLGRGFELSGIDLVYGTKGGSSRNFGTRRQQ